MMNVNVASGYDTEGHLKAMHFQAEVESGLVVNVTLPLQKLSVLEQAWPEILATVDRSLAQLRSQERERIQKHLDSLA